MSEHTKENQVGLLNKDSKSYDQNAKARDGNTNKMVTQRAKEDEEGKIKKTPGVTSCGKQLSSEETSHTQCASNGSKVKMHKESQKQRDEKDKWLRIWNSTLVPELVGIAAEIAIQIYGYVSTKRVLYLVLTIAAIPEFVIPAMFKSRFKDHVYIPTMSKVLLIVALVAPIWVVIWLEEVCEQSNLPVKILLIIDMAYMSMLTSFKVVCAVKLRGNNRVMADLTCSITCTLSLVAAIVVTYKCDVRVSNAMSAVAVTLPLIVMLSRFIKLENGCC